MCFERVDIKIEIQETQSVTNVLSTCGFLIFTVKYCGDPKKLIMYKEI